MIGRRKLLQAMALAAAPSHAWAKRASPAPTTLRMIHGSNLSSFDPIWTTAPATNDFAMMVYDQLVAVDENYVTRPQMAEGWSVEDGGRSVVFKLREGLSFHDGEPVRSFDCIASIARWSVRDSFGQIVAAFTDSMQAIDDRSFRIRLKRPFPLLPDAIGKANSSQCVMMPKRFAETDPALQVAEPIGSGPYRFIKSEWVPGAFAAFAKFDKYIPRQEPVSGLAGGRAPNVDRIEWSFTSDAATALAAMQEGDQDYWDSPVPDLIPVIKSSPDLVVGTRSAAGIYYALVMNHLHPPFDNPAVRQAVAMAIDQDDFVRAASGEQPDNAGHCASFYMCGSRYASDAGGAVLSERSVDKARAALKSSGYAAEKTVLLAAGDPPAIGAISQVVEQLLRSVGFDVQTVTTDFAGMAQRRVSREPVEKGGWSIFPTTYGGVGLINPGANIMMRGAGPSSWIGWPTDAKLEQLRQAWFETSDPAEQMRLAHDIQIQAFQTLPYIPLGFSTQPHVWSRKVTGVFPAPVNAYWNIGKSA